MSNVIAPLDRPSNYKDSQIKIDRTSQENALAKSATLYVGNLSFYTTEEQIYELFSKCTSPEEGGGVKRIIMGLDRNTKTPCGFCFVEYYTHAEALACLRYVSGTKLDERIVRCDLDLGYKEGRQFGRGKSGGQVRDEHRQDYDAGRGGWGAQATKAQLDEEKRRKEREEVYADAGDYPGAVAGGGGDWKQTAEPVSKKRGREEDDDDESEDGRSYNRVRAD